MNCYELIASLIDSLAWPVTVFAVAYMFRESLLDLLKKLEKVNIGKDGIELKLQKGEALIPSLAKVQPVATPEKEKEKFDKLVDLMPQSAILAKYAEVEASLQDLARKVGVSPLHDSFVFIISVMCEREIIDASMTKLLENLRSIGMDVRSSVSHASFSKSDALRYGALADIALAHLQMARTNQEKI